VSVADTFRNAHALAIGVGGNLPVTVKDAKAIAKIFADPERCAVPKRNVKVLTGSKATHDGIVTALQGLAQRASADDVVTVYFSGHGAMLPTTPPRRFLVPHDRNWLDGGEFTELLGAIQAQRLLVLLDCCYAGGIHAEPGVKAADARPDPVPFDLHELQLRTGSGTVVISSSGPNEISLPGEPYSIFTQVLIEALYGCGARKQDGYVRVTELAMYLAQWVPQLTGERQHPTLELERADNYPVAYYAAGSKAVIQPPGWFADVAADLDRTRAAADLARTRAAASLPSNSPAVAPGPVMTVDDAIQALHKFLSENIWDKDEAIRIVRRSKTPVVWSGDNVSFWDKVLSNVHRSSRMAALFTSADELVGENLKWQKAKQDYLLACDADRRAGEREVDDKGSGVVDAALNARYLRELGDALGSIAAQQFRDPLISRPRLTIAGRALLAVEPMAAALHAAAETETRQPRLYVLQRADRALATHHKEVAGTLSALEKVGSEKAAKPLCDDLEQQAPALLAAYAQAIRHVT
jgi:hypothetical protein